MKNYALKLDSVTISATETRFEPGYNALASQTKRGASPAYRTNYLKKK